MFHRVPFFLPLLYPNLVWRMPTSENEVYLTFDDGPVPGPTDVVLEALDKYSIKATFFCIGDNVRKHPDVFNRVVTKDHQIGNHTFNHLKGWSTSVEEYVSNIKACETEILNQHAGRSDSQFSILNSKLFRPPYGRITRSQIKALPEYKIIMWDVLSIDYNRNVSREACLKNSIAATRPGSVIVFHDSVKAERNMSYALPRYIEHLLGQGYTFKMLAP